MTIKSKELKGSNFPLHIRIPYIRITARIANEEKN